MHHEWRVVGTPVSLDAHPSTMTHAPADPSVHVDDQGQGAQGRVAMVEGEELLERLRVHAGLLFCDELCLGVVLGGDVWVGECVGWREIESPTYDPFIPNVVHHDNGRTFRDVTSPMK